MSGFLRAAALMLAFCGICNAAEFRKIVLSGEQAPALPSGTQFKSFNSVQLDAGGNVGFSASTTSGSGIWRFHEGNIQKVVLAGEAAPGRAGLLSGFSRFTLIIPPVTSNLSQLPTHHSASRVSGLVKQ